MEIQPAASLRGALRVPGDKSMSHRALLVGAVCDGETVVRGFGRSLDTESTLAALRIARRLGRGRRLRRAAGARPRAHGSARAGRADRLRKRRNACPAAPRPPRRPGGTPLRADRRRLAPLAADGPRGGSALGDGRARGDERRAAAARDRGTAALGHRARARGGERPGEVVRPAGRPQRRRAHDGRRTRRDARPHRADAPRGGSEA